MGLVVCKVARADGVVWCLVQFGVKCSFYNNAVVKFLVTPWRNNATKTISIRVLNGKEIPQFRYITRKRI